jgi:hypothetical protein
MPVPLITKEVSTHTAQNCADWGGQVLKRVLAKINQKQKTMYTFCIINNHPFFEDLMIKDKQKTDWKSILLRMRINVIIVFFCADFHYQVTPFCGNNKELCKMALTFGLFSFTIFESEIRGG